MSETSAKPTGPRLAVPPKITAAGTYVFSGDCDNGSITVKKGVTGVTIVLNGLTLTNDDSAAITLNKTAEASLIAAAGTTNTVADTEGGRTVRTVRGGRAACRLCQPRDRGAF